MTQGGKLVLIDVLKMLLSDQSQFFNLCLRSALSLGVVIPLHRLDSL
jgi:hypothetical protein